MDLTNDRQIGPYRIEGLIASGGMGDVYKAWHTGLERHVALKTISERIAADEETARRFSREARLISSLNHPHICQVYDYLVHEGQPVLVMEYLEGETLSARLDRGRLPIEDVARVGAQIADALDYAHRQNLIHRDLKTSNVMLTETGVKVLDFGLVKRIRKEEADGAQESGSTELLTRENAFFGTLPYMSPEQVSGKGADARSDIYALGVLLYVATTGRLPFVRATNAALASAILHDVPDPVQALVPSTPPALAHAIERCLEKKPDHRWQSARDLAGELHWLTAQGLRRPQLVRMPRVVVAVLAVIAVLTVIAGMAYALIDGGRSAGRGGVIASSIVAPPGVIFPANHPEAVISPDGERVLLSGIDSAGQSWLWVRPLSEPGVQRLEVTQGAHTPFWSADGRSIGFFRRNELRIVDLGGAPSTLVAAVSLESRGATWNSDNLILYAPQPDSGLVMVRPGSAPEAVTRPDRARGEIGHLWPQFLPDGEHFLYYVTSARDSISGIYLASLSQPRGRRLVHSRASGWYASGHLLYLRDDALIAQGMEVSTGQLSGDARSIVNPVAAIETLGAFSASRTGVLTYSAGESKDVTELTWIGREGRARSTVGSSNRYRNPALTQDGRRLAVELYDNPRGDLMVRDLSTDRITRVNNPALQPRNPVWSPDHQSLIFESRNLEGWALYRWDVASNRAPQVVLVSETAKMPTDWSPDGTRIALANRTQRGDYDISILDLATGTERPWFVDTDDEVTARFSPSGRLVAYGSNATGEFEIFVEAVQPSANRCRISVAGGWDPQWGADDDVLYFLDPRGVFMRATLSPGRDCVTGPPEALFETRIDPRTSRNHYVVAPSEDSYLFNMRRLEPRAHTVGVLINWPSGAVANLP